MKGKPFLVILHLKLLCTNQKLTCTMVFYLFHCERATFTLRCANEQRGHAAVVAVPFGTLASVHVCLHELFLLSL